MQQQETQAALPAGETAFWKPATHGTFEVMLSVVTESKYSSQAHSEVARKADKRLLLYSSGQKCIGRQMVRGSSLLDD